MIEPLGRGKKQDSLICTKETSAMLTHLSLFTGIGGIDIAAEAAGFETVGQCEFADYPTKVLEKHWPTVPRWRDIHDVTANDFRLRTGIESPTIISGGFPCQPFSVAGKQKGEADDRHLWPEMLRIIQELTPHWVIGENVPGIMSIAGDAVCQGLEREGYEVGIFNYEAASIGAPHRRARVFFVAHARYCGCAKQADEGEQPRGADAFGAGEITPHTHSTRKSQPQRCICNIGGWTGNGCHYVSDPNSAQSTRLPWGKKAENTSLGVTCGYVPNPHNRGRPMRRDGQLSTTPPPNRSGAHHRAGTQEYEPGQWGPAEPGMGGVANGLPAWLDGFGHIVWPPEPDIPRLAHGVPDRRDRLKCLGNAVVPAQIYPILAAIAQVEREGMSTNG